MTETITESVKKAKAEIKSKAESKSNPSGCCDIAYEGDGEIKSVRVEVAENGFIVSVNYDSVQVVVKTAKEAGEAVQEFLT